MFSSISTLLLYINLYSPNNSLVTTDRHRNIQNKELAVSSSVVMHFSQISSRKCFMSAAF